MSDHQQVQRNQRQEISNAVARLYKLHLGRGPTRVTTLVDHDLVVCVVKDTDTPFEQTLLKLDAADLVHQARTRFQQFAAEHLVSVIEVATSQRVLGHVPGYSPTCNAATEVFFLDPAAERPFTANAA